MSVRVVSGSVRRFGSLDAGKAISDRESSNHSSSFRRHSSWDIIQDELPATFDDEREVFLAHSKHQNIPMKDFSVEVRAHLDVTHLLEQAVFLLDVTETSCQGIIDLMLGTLLSAGTSKKNSGGDAIIQVTSTLVDEARSALFTHADGTGRQSDAGPFILADTIQGMYYTKGSISEFDQSWICVLCNLPSLTARRIAIARLKTPANVGLTCQEVRLVVLVLCPSKEKRTKDALETGRTFATVLSDEQIRGKLLKADSEDDFKNILLEHSHGLALKQRKAEEKLHMASCSSDDLQRYQKRNNKCFFGRQLLEDIARRVPHYLSDYKDGFADCRSIQKVVSTTFFLYFACILPSIAFGVLNDQNTHGKINVAKVIFGQATGGVFYAVFSGQPLLILLTTAPLAIYIKVIHSICHDFELDFFAMYCCVGLWSSFFLALYSFCGLSRLMKWSRRSTEEIFALFISVAFFVDASRDVVNNFMHNYLSRACHAEYITSKIESLHLLSQTNNVTNMASQVNFPGSSSFGLNATAAVQLASKSLVNMIAAGEKNLNTSRTSNNWSSDDTLGSQVNEHQELTCQRDSSILYLFLLVGTVWLGVSLYNFRKTRHLRAGMREALSDYSLPIAVLSLSFVGSFIFKDVPLERFKYNGAETLFNLAKMGSLSIGAIFGAMGLGFMLSLLFFMDQNISAAMVNDPRNKLKKGPAYHLDLLVVAILNGILSAVGLPWMHGAIPHSPLHVRSLADVEERTDGGHVYETVVKVRETRVAAIAAHILIGASMFLLPYPLAYIPTPVLDGLFLYMAVTSLAGNQMFERITLLFMEQAAYPPNHYIRRVPQRKIHLFTGCQVLQLVVLCAFGFSSSAYIKMVFPVLLILLLPMRHKIVASFMDEKHLDAIDSEHQ